MSTKIQLLSETVRQTLKVIKAYTLEVEKNKPLKRQERIACETGILLLTQPVYDSFAGIHIQTWHLFLCFLSLKTFTHKKNINK